MNVNRLFIILLPKNIRKKNVLKRILLFILLIIGTGCKVSQQPVSKAEKQPESSIKMTSEDVLHAVTELTNNAEKTAQIDSINTLDTITGLNTNNDTEIIPDSISTLHPDSTFIATDGMLTTDSLTTDTIPIKKGSLEANVDYQAKDSIVWTAGNMAFLYGEGDVKYQDIALTSEIIQIKMDSSTVYAVHGTDSLGEEYGYPVFVPGGDQSLEAKEMYYNFKTKKALAINVVTQQGEGYVKAALSKKMEDGTINMEDGIYTTCDADHPHFHIRMTKAKTRPGKDVVSGPAYLVIEDVPLFPLVLPFAFFPFTDSYSSGILMPTYGDEMSRGFYLRDGGYYFALSDYVDFALTGELYTKGSWGLSGRSSYRKRYKYSGSFDLSYLTTKLGDKGLDDYNVSKDFKVRWSHSQDNRANPFRTFSSSVDYSTSSYDRKSLNTLYTPSATQNNKGSSISFSQRFPNKPVSISATMNINQRSQDSSVSVTLPDMTITMSRIYPLKRKNAVGKERWYEKISINYNGQLRNSISTKEDKLFNSSLVKDWKNAMQHKSDISATYNLFGVLNLTPNMSYTERWYTSKVNQGYDPTTGRVAPTDTTYGFYRVYNYNASVSASTTIYGFFEPIKPLRKFVSRIRHRMDPSISFSVTPDFGDPKYGFYNTYTYHDGIKDITSQTIYSPFNGQLFGVPGQGRSGSINFTLDNNIEAKVPDENDPTGERKITIIDKLSASTGYNLVADSFQWNNINAGLRFKVPGSNYTVNLNAVFDPYIYDYSVSRDNTITPRRVDKTRWAAGKGIGRLMSTGTSFSYTLNNDVIKKLFGGGDDKTDKKKKTTNPDMLGEDEYDPLDPNNPYDPEEDLQAVEERESGGRLNRNKKSNDGEYDGDGYYNVAIPWSFSFNYNISMAYDRQKFDIEKKEYKYKFTHALTFNGSIQPTKNWRVQFNATYDVERNKLAYMTCNISRSMHCWQMSASIIPIGPLKSYSFSISANASMLKDLKYDQSSSPYNNSMNTWY